MHMQKPSTKLIRCTDLVSLPVVWWETIYAQGWAWKGPKTMVVETNNRMQEMQIQSGVGRVAGQLGKPNRVVAKPKYQCRKCGGPKQKREWFCADCKIPLEMKYKNKPRQANSVLSDSGAKTKRANEVD